MKRLRHERSNALIAHPRHVRPPGGRVENSLPGTEVPGNNRAPSGRGWRQAKIYRREFAPRGLSRLRSQIRRPRLWLRVKWRIECIPRPALLLASTFVLLGLLVLLVVLLTVVAFAHDLLLWKVMIC